MEDQMRARVRHHQLHRHRDVQRIVARPEGAARIGVPQPVRTVPQPRPARPAAEPEEPGVGRHLRPLHPARARPPAARPHPPRGSHQRGGRSRRSTTPPGVRTSTAPCRDTTTSHPLRRPPASRRPCRAPAPPADPAPGHAPGQRVRRLRLGPVPAAEDRPARRDPHPQRRPGEPDHPAARPRLRPRTAPGHPRPLGAPRAAARRRPPAVPRHAARTDRSPCAAPTEPTILHRPHQVTPVHAAQPAIDGRRARAPFNCRSPVVADHIFTTRRLCGAHPGAEVDHMASSMPAASRAHPSRVRGTHAARPTHDAHSPGAAP